MPKQTKQQMNCRIKPYSNDMSPFTTKKNDSVKQCEQTNIQITITQMNGEEFCYRIKSETTIGDLMFIIEQDRGHKASLQQLFSIDGEECNSSTRLTDDANFSMCVWSFEEKAREFKTLWIS